MRVPAIILSAIVATGFPQVASPQASGGSSTEYIRTPDGPRELKFFYEGSVTGEGNVLMLSGRGETAYLDLEHGMKVVFSGTVVESSADAITLEAPQRSQRFEVTPDTSICKDGTPGLALTDLEPGTPATVQTSVEAFETAEKIITGLHVVNPMGSFADQPAIAACN